MRQGVRIGVDAGSVRIGVARSDPGGILASPLETVRAGKGDIDRIVQIVAENDAIEVVVGLPTSLSGREGPAAATARRFAEKIAQRLEPETVRLFDERLTTVTAESGLRDKGVRGQARRKVVDQAAAAVLLQAALEAERLTGRPPGETVQGDS
ncbi:Holliday junction resolvase RuvX [Actinoallomurus rhizosphaericola]|uniref:Holliday junction resolvase RuvX n=1 Tax=Actinoallomurus rhizosphaericola TaxID=2952536 RepID=UPI002093293C|nr:Holliday junction resolvase RuvX [Actinoallomurus rhizosphaericola]MCO5996901.1 Holliday junction resolvase RuvX [Actinoallomurus rhizosphaericola]